MEEHIIILNGPQVKWYQSVGDFFNILKAFIGTNYQALPFAFHNSGLALGIVGVAVIAALTDHCCQLLIKSKDHVVDLMCEEQVSSGQIDRDEEPALRRRLERSVGYGDVGKAAFGAPCFHVVQFAVWFTQFCTCISYFIFIGNTIFMMFPMYPKPYIIRNNSQPTEHFPPPAISANMLGQGIPMLNIPNLASISHRANTYMDFGIYAEEEFTTMSAYNIHGVPSGKIRGTGDEDAYHHPSPSTVPQASPTAVTFGGHTPISWTSNLSGDAAKLAASSSNTTLRFLSGKRMSELNQAHKIVLRNRTFVRRNADVKTSRVVIPLSRNHRSLIIPDSGKLPDTTSSAIFTNDSTTVTAKMISLITAERETTSAETTSTASPPNVTVTVPAANTTVPTYKGTTAPDLRLLMLIPVPFFLATSLIRKIRYIAPFSSIATVALAIGALSVLGFMIFSFELSATFAWYKLSTFPLFLGQLISAYEGIGCVIPTQSSMDGNRHLFPGMLHGAVAIVFCILCSFGILGYLKFGEEVQQIIILNVGHGGLLSDMVCVTLVISVLFTFPLQCFPVIEIMESYLFTPGKCCGPKSPRLEYDEIGGSSGLINTDGDEEHGLLGYSMETSMEASVASVAAVIPLTVPAWKRNFFRILLVLVTIGLAIVLRRDYAYLSSFTGAVGASLLAFILPCLIHLKLRWPDLGNGIKVKDILIVSFAVSASVLTLVAIVQQIIEGKIAV